MVEMEHFSLQVPKDSIGKIETFLGENPEIQFKREGVIGPIDEQWQEEFLQLSDLVASSNRLVNEEYDVRTIRNYVRFINSLKMTHAEGEFFPPDQMSLKVIMRLFDESIEAYRSVESRPVMKGTNKYMRVKEGVLTPRSMRIIIWGNGLSGDIKSKEEICELEGIQTKSYSTHLRSSKQQLLHHLAPDYYKSARRLLQ